MATMNPLNNVPNVSPTSPASNPSTPHHYSSRTPGEGYPFPRTQRHRTNYQQNTLTVTQTTTVYQQVLPERSAPIPLPSIIDMEVFNQLLAMEDEDLSEQANGPFSFTKGLVEVYFEDGECTVEQMECALAENDHKRLSQLAHYLRGSAASLGVSQVAATCEALELELLRRSSYDFSSLREKVRNIKEGQISAKNWFDEFYKRCV